jgi:GAF domain-containing protein
MRRRSRASSKLATARSSKAKTLKAARQHSSSPAGQETEVARLTRELNEALERHTATTEILKIISASPTDLQSVLEVVVKSAARFCEADDVSIFELDGQDLRSAAHWGPVPPLDIGVRFPCSRGTVAGRIVLERRPIHVIDLQAEAEEFPEGSAFAKRLGHRTILGAPLLRAGVAIGTIQLRRTDVHPFTDRQISLLETFAAQAVIAIENARLLNELRQSLEQQTATADVLRVISSSPGELEPVFQAMLENAIRICDANFGTLLRRDGDAFRLAAGIGIPPKLAEFHRQHETFQPVPGSPLDRAMRTKRVSHTADEAAQAAPSPPATLAGARSLVCVPMLKDDTLSGAIVIYRQEVRPFTDKQIEVVKNFAAQAVIAIENTRLLNELRQRTTDLAESLEQQTATSEVLRFVSTSPGELRPVFEAMLANAVRLCEASYGALWLREGAGWRNAAFYGELPEAYTGQWRSGMVTQAGVDAPMDRIAQSLKPLHIPDCRADQSYLDGHPLFVNAVDVGGVRTYLGVPMLKANTIFGVIAIYRTEVGPFNEKQIALVANFAAQAVIAIENARLLNELRESLEQQTATADVLRVISSSPGDLGPVFQAMLENAARICGATFGALFLADGDGFRHVAAHNAPLELIEERRRIPVIRPRPGTSIARVAATKRPAQIDDIRAETAYTDDPGRLAIVNAGARTMLSVPMLKDDDLVGQIAIYRQEVQPFNEKQIALLQNFAAQAVIAIENARLLNELRESLEQQTATADVLRVISSSPGELQPVFEAMLQNAVRICDAQFGNLALFEFENDGFRFVAQYGAPPKYRDARQREPFIRRKARGNLDRVIKTKQVDHVADMAAEEPDSGIVTLGGARTLVTVPMLKDNELVGMIAIYRQEVRPFSEKQIELLQNFAAQAVIAIENARLLNELRQRTDELSQRTDDLSEALEQQTATSEVLRVISSSPGELEPVFQTMLENATHICEAKFGMLFRLEDGAMRPVASLGLPEPLMEFFKHGPHRPSEHAPIMRVARTKQAVHVLDFTKERAYLEGSPVAVAGVELGGIRTNLLVPLLKDNELIGAFAIYRQEVRPFADKRSSKKLRRASRDRHRECAAAQ